MRSRFGQTVRCRKPSNASFKIAYLLIFPDGIDGEYRGCLAPNRAWICPLLECSIKQFNSLLQRPHFCTHESLRHSHHLEQYYLNSVIITHGRVEFYVKPILRSASHLRPVARFQRCPKQPCVIFCV